MKAESPLGRLCWFLLRDESGQDLIEYGLLTAFIGLVGVVAWANIRAGIGIKYSGWGSGVQVISGCTPDPIAYGGAPCP